jgi:ubiquinone/menaquinone biosynthesis C-methylase UbiE
MYDQFAAIYDAMHDHKNYEEESRYVRERILGMRPGARTLLEVACGTGRFLEKFRAHFEVEGLDNSPAMLEQAGKRIAVPLHEGDMVDFDLGKQFDVVCVLFRSIACVKTKENLVLAVRAMARHLQPDGLLLIEPFFTAETFWVDRVTLNEVKRDDLKVAWMYVSKRSGAMATLVNHWVIGRPEGIEHIQEVQELGLFAREDFELAFAQAGLGLAYDPKGPSGVGLYIGFRN